MKIIKESDRGCLVACDDGTFAFVDKGGADSCYRDIDAYERGSGTCYVPTSLLGLKFANGTKVPYLRSDFEDLVSDWRFGGKRIRRSKVKEYARKLFDECEWAAPYAYMETWEVGKEIDARDLEREA